MTIIGRIVEEWGMIAGAHVRVDPLCQATVERDDDLVECDRPATVRRSYWPYWSQFFCPEHAATFDEPREVRPGYFEFWARYSEDGEVDLEKPTFMRRVAA